jgi:tRNA G18 (ribose-2'-O)-methylase SpoU
VPSEADLVDALVAHGHTVLALSPRGGLEIGAAPPPPGKLALLLGAEGPGLSAATLARCRTARVPMRPRAGLTWDSLNVAATSAIALHWLRCGQLG